MNYQLSDHDLINMRDEEGDPITKEVVQRWIDTHCGDFSQVVDWRADFGDDLYVKDWDTEDGEMAFIDAMYIRDRDEEE